MEEVLQICRLCLATNLKEDDQELNGKLSVMLNLFLPKSQFRIIQPRICHSCVSKLEMSYNFKLKCMDNKEKIRTFINDTVGINLHLETIKIENICCLCFKTDNNVSKIKVLVKYLNRCVPELDLKVSGAPTVCQICCEIMQSMYTFIKVLLDVEGKIKRYMLMNKVKEVQLTNKLNLYNTMTKTIRNISQQSEVHDLGDTYSNEQKIKTEVTEENFLPFETQYLELNRAVVMDQIKQPNNDTKIVQQFGKLLSGTNKDSNSDLSIKTQSAITVTETKTEMFEKSNQLFETCFLPELKINTNSNEGTKIQPNKTEMEDNSCEQIESHYLEELGNFNSTRLKLNNDEVQNVIPQKSNNLSSNGIEENICEHFEPHYLGQLGNFINLNNNIKGELNDEDVPSPTLNIDDIPQRTFPCKKCSYTALTQNELKYHFLSHRNSRMYECHVCAFVTRHKNVIDNHNLTHLTDEEVVWYNCDTCTFKTRLQGNLVKHKLTHKQSDELKKYKCEDCPYKTMWRRDLERHQMKHKETSFSCGHCLFSTKHKRYLKQHIQRVHSIKEESSTETEMFFCAHCSFSTKHKRSLIPHMVTHRNEEDLEWYTCKFCSYKAKWKSSITIHETTHVEKYKCDQCDFQTTLKRYLNEHLRGHLPIPLYTCAECDFNSHYKQALTQHSLKHRSPDEIKVYQCPHCQYNSKRAPDLKQHIAILHAEDTEEHKCSVCSYKTRCKKRLKNHEKMLHGESDKITKFQCTSCSFQTKYKASFLNHQMCIHKKNDEASLIKCPDCDYKTVRKDMLSKHILVHKSTSEIEMFECYHCSYKSKYKRALIRHMQGHQDQSMKKEVILECGKCDYKTKWKHALKRHALKHMEEVEVKMEIDVDKTEIEWRAIDEGTSLDVQTL